LKAFLFPFGAPGGLIAQPRLCFLAGRSKSIWLTSSATANS
jgi:hypothetical protein